MTRKHPSQKRPAAEADPVLGEQVHHAIDDLGWAVPTDEQAVARAEAARAAAPVDLPAALGDPAAVFEGGASARDVVVAAFSADTGIEATLSRAAREGGPIPPEIEQRMREDRVAAENEQNDGTQTEAETS